MEIHRAAAILAFLLGVVLPGISIASPLVPGILRAHHLHLSNIRSQLMGSNSTLDVSKLRKVDMGSTTKSPSTVRTQQNEKNSTHNATTINKRRGLAGQFGYAYAETCSDCIVLSSNVEKCDEDFGKVANTRVSGNIQYDTYSHEHFECVLIAEYESEDPGGLGADFNLDWCSELKEEVPEWEWDWTDDTCPRSAIYAVGTDTTSEFTITFSYRYECDSSNEVVFVSKMAITWDNGATPPFQLELVEEAKSQQCSVEGGDVTLGYLVHFNTGDTTSVDTPTSVYFPTSGSSTGGEPFLYVLLVVLIGALVVNA